MKLTHPFFIYRLFIAGFLLLAFSHVYANQLKSVRTWPSPDKTRIVLDLSSQPNYEIHYLKRPDRLVIDILSTNSSVNLKSITHKGPLVKNIRESASNSKNTFRLVIDLKQQSKAKIFTLSPEKPYGHRLVLDLPHQTHTPPETEKIRQPVSAGRDVIIAIDAGHGGDDPGALGQFSYEKTVNLQIAKRLQKRINRQLGMSAFLIRTGDYYVNLDKRSELAVKGKADFLVSIHADGFSSSQPSGASVWILSDRRANSEMGRRMERHEVHSELLGGKGAISESVGSVPFLNKVFFDMSKSNSMQVGSDVADLVVKELKKITKLHKEKPVGASLAVLKSPYIPSILVEAGFITNHREERLLNQAEYQNKITNAVFKGIFKHFTVSPPHDSLFAQKKRTIKHTVRSGESLSIIGARYSVSSHQLKSYNRLRSSSLRIGQVLNIPPNYELFVKRDAVQKVAKLQPAMHTVKRGESLSVIASYYGKTTTELKNYNKLRSTSLAIGQKIKIPNHAITTVTRVHIVRSGESLSVIAARYNKSVVLLKDYNNLPSTSLAIGQKIKIPNSAIARSTSRKVVARAPKKVLRPSVHTVRSGESLSVIAARYNITMQALKNYNKLPSTSLRIGQKLNLPQGGINIVGSTAKESPKPSIHRVRSGESLSLIASRYGNTTNELKNYNKLHSTVLRVGQKLKIPPSGINITGGTSARKASVHSVRRGESLSVIASYYGTSSSFLTHYNKLKSTRLLIGQKIKIPADANKLTTHKVRSGESLSVIAKRYGTSASEIKLLNKLRSNSLAIGQLLTIPTT